MRHPIFAASFAALLSAQASADFIGFEIGVAPWQQNYDGMLQSGGELIDLDQQLGFEDETNNSYYVLFEHPVPVLPNIMVMRTELDINARNPNATFTFDGLDFDGSITTVSDLSHNDVTLYYEILDNWVSVDIGLTARIFEEGIQVTGQLAGTNISDTASLDVDQTIPMLYVGAEIELPFTGLYISANANAITYGGDGFTDIRAALGYENSLGFGVELGYRTFDIDYEDDDDVVDVTIDGAYLGLFYHF